MFRLFTIVALLMACGCTSEEGPSTSVPPDGAQSTGPDSPNVTPPDSGTGTNKPPIATTDPNGESTTTKKPPIETAPPIELTPETKQAIANLVSKDRQAKEKGEIAVENLEGKAVDSLLAAIVDSDADVRAGGAYGLLGRFNPLDERMVAAFLAALADSDSRVRGSAFSAASQLDAVRLEPANQTLAEILANSQEPPHVRAQAARLLATLSTAAFEPLKKALLNDPDRGVRMACLGGVVESASDPAQAVAALVAALNDKSDLPLRRRAAARLGELGRNAAPAVAPLSTAMLEEDERLSAACAAALTHIGPQAVPALAKLVSAGAKPQRLLALAALAQLGPLAVDAQPAVERAAQDNDAEIKDSAQLTLRSIIGM